MEKPILGSLLQLTGYASYTELMDAGIKKTYDLGINDFGFREKIIELMDGSQWDWMPEDMIYELRKGDRYEITINYY